MEDWRELLGRKWDGVDDEYGPHSHAVVSAFETLAEVPWFERVGTLAPEAPGVVVVCSWEEVFSHFDVAGDTYEAHGHLREPALVCLKIMETPPNREWYLRAREDAGDYYSYLRNIPQGLGAMADWLSSYVYQYISYLLAEIIGADDGTTTYFRELLPWFHAGHLPCGWEGDWPAGRLRVF